MDLFFFAGQIFCSPLVWNSGLPIFTFAFYFLCVIVCTERKKLDLCPTVSCLMLRMTVIISNYICISWSSVKAHGLSLNGLLNSWKLFFSTPSRCKWEMVKGNMFSWHDHQTCNSNMVPRLGRPNGNHVYN